MASATANNDNTASKNPPQERHRYFALAFCWADILLEIDRSWNLIFASGATEPILGHKPKDLVGTCLSDLVDDRDRILLKQVFAMIERQGRVQGMRIRLGATTGCKREFEVAGHALDAQGDLFLAIRTTNCDNCRAEIEGKQRDQVSGLLEADHFADVVAERLSQSHAQGSGEEMTVVSLDGLGDLTESLGEGDKEHLLHTVGTCLRAHSVDGETAGKVGDDAFGFIHSGDIDIAEIEAEIREATEVVTPEGSDLSVSVSAGTLDTDFGDVNEADLAKGLVYVLNQLRDSESGLSVAEISSNLNGLVSEALESVSSFRGMTAQDRFEIALHPILDVETGDCHHYEALVRFNGNYEESPYRYITFAEETGLISEFDIAMATKAVHWLAQRPTGKESLAVNISGNSVANDDYVKKLLSLLDENTWTKGRLMFEITESARMADLEEANRFIQKVRERGYPVCLDDFGAGAASFQYMSTLEVDVVKLDGSAVKNAEKAPKGTAFLMGLTGLCKNLKVKTIAEMVDTPETLDFVRKCGVEYAQGYLFGKPSPDIGVFHRKAQTGLFESKKVVNLHF